MTNNDEMALKPVGNLFTSDKGEVLFSPSKWPISGFEFAGCVYSAEQVNTLLAERDADKKRIEMLEAANASQDDHINQQQDRIDALEQRNSELGKYAGKLESISTAAEKLVRCKGRYHSEQNYRALAALFGVTTPDLPPLETEARTVSVNWPDGWHFEECETEGCQNGAIFSVGKAANNLHLCEACTKAHGNGRFTKTALPKRLPFNLGAGINLKVGE